MDRTTTRKLFLFLGLNIISLACSFPFTALIPELPSDQAEVDLDPIQMGEVEPALEEQTSVPKGLLSSSEEVYLLDLATMESSLLFELGSEFPQHTISNDIQLAFTQEDALRCLEIRTQEETCFVPFLHTETETLSYIPEAWYDPAHIIAVQYRNHLEGGGWKQVKEIGLLNIADHSFHPFPSSDLPLQFDESCQIELGLSPKLDILALTIYSYAEICEEILPGAYVIDIETGAIDPILSYSGASDGKIDYGALDAVWSQDGEELALIVAEPLRSDPSDVETSLTPWQLFVYDLTQKNLIPITEHEAGRIFSPVWGTDGSLYYGLVETTLNGIYAQGSRSDEPVLILEGYISPVSVSPAQSHLVYRDEIGISWRLNVMDLSTKESRSVSLPVEGPPVGIEFLGWVE